jgi:IS30 family transposase
MAHHDHRRSQTRPGTATDHNGPLTNTEAPKGTDLGVHSAADLDWVAQELNDRPRKRLEFRKPIELIEDPPVAMTA